MYLKYSALYLDYSRCSLNADSLLTDYMSVLLEGRQVEDYDYNIYHFFVRCSPWVKSRAVDVLWEVGKVLGETCVFVHVLLAFSSVKGGG